MERERRGGVVETERSVVRTDEKVRTLKQVDRVNRENGSVKSAKKTVVFLEGNRAGYKAERPLRGVVRKYRAIKSEQLPVSINFLIGE